MHAFFTVLLSLNFKSIINKNLICFPLGLTQLNREPVSLASNVSYTATLTLDDTDKLIIKKLQTLLCFLIYLDFLAICFNISSVIALIPAFSKCIPSGAKYSE